MNKATGKPCKYLRCNNAGENESYVQQLCAENNIQLEMTAPNTPQMNGVVERSFATCQNCAFTTMYCVPFSLATQGLLWQEAMNTFTKIRNSLLPRQGLALDPHRAWYEKDAVTNRIISHLQPFDRIAYVKNREKLKAKLDDRAKKCVFVGYAQDHLGDTYKFYNPATKQTIISHDIHQWMEWHGRITATDNLDLFTELEKLKTDSIILPALPDVPFWSDHEDFPNNSAMPDLVSRISIAKDNPEVSVPTDVDIYARRNLTSDFNEGAVTRSRARQLTYADVDHRNNNTMEERKINLEEFIDYLLVLNASLESDPKPSVPKTYKELVKSKDKKWLKSMHDKLGNFLNRGAWEYFPRSKIPKTRTPLRCRWLFKEKHDGTKKSRLVVCG